LILEDIYEQHLRGQLHPLTEQQHREERLQVPAFPRSAHVRNASIERRFYNNLQEKPPYFRQSRIHLPRQHLRDIFLYHKLSHSLPVPFLPQTRQIRPRPDECLQSAQYLRNRVIDFSLLYLLL
jgi:hypothetical protein